MRGLHVHLLRGGETIPDPELPDWLNLREGRRFEADTPVRHNGVETKSGVLGRGDILVRGDDAVLVCPHEEAECGGTASGPSPDAPTVMAGGPAAPPPAPSPDLPRALGRWHLLREIGHGGLGAVYEAYDPATRRLAAVKILDSVRVDAPLSARFFQEMDTLARLDHPHVVRVLDTGRDGPDPYIAMSLIDGPTMEQAAHSGRLPLYDAAAVVAKVALTVDYIHRQEILHRDLKPGNIMLRPDGEPVVLDFGLARLAGDPARAMTLTGSVMGTPPYMAPEQARGEPKAAGPKIDIFSLGSVLHFALTGAAPFRADDVFELLRHVIEDPPDPVEGRFASSPTVRAEHERIRAGACPARAGAGTDALFATYMRLAQVARAAMTKSPDARPENAAQVAESVNEALAAIGMPGGW